MKRFNRVFDICCGIFLAFNKIVYKDEERNNAMISDDAEKNRKSARKTLVFFR